MNLSEQPLIVVSNLTKEFANEQATTPVLAGVSFAVERGHLAVIVGPSGCGKTTLLRILAGLECPDAGAVMIASRSVSGPSPEKGLVFQEVALFPWLNVRRNIAFGLAIGGLPPQEIEARVAHYIRLVGLEDWSEFYPHQLSGGMKQRVALARSLIVQPQVLLLDEPFGHLDSHVRRLLQDELLQVLSATQTTALLVTHDVEEATYLADAVFVLSARPATVKQTYQITAARPRSRDDPYLRAVCEELDIATTYEAQTKRN